MRSVVTSLIVVSALVVAGCGEEKGSSTKTGIEEGEKIPNLEFEDMNDQEMSIRDFDGQVLFITIGTGWCPPCQAETPGFQAVYEDHADDGLVIVQALFEDYNGFGPSNSFMEAWRDEYGITFTLVPDVGANFWEALVPPSNEGYIPHNIIIDRDQNITYTDYGSMAEQSLRNRIDDLLADE